MSSDAPSSPQNAPTPSTGDAPAPGAPSVAQRRRVRRRRLAIGAVVALVVYTLVGFFAVPWLIKSWLIPRIDRTLSGTLSVTRVATNPFTFSLTIEGFSAKDNAGTELLAFEKFEGGFRPFASLFGWRWHFAAASVTRPRVSAAIDRAGAIDWAAFLTPPPPPPPPPGAPAPSPAAAPSEDDVWHEFPRVALDNLKIIEAGATFGDDSTTPPVRLSWSDVSFVIDRLETHPDFANTHTFKANLPSGGMIEWKGAVHLNPLASTGVVIVNGFDVVPLWPYAKRFTRVDLNRGRVSFEAAYDVAPAVPQARVVIDGASLVDAELTLEREPLLAVPTARVSHVALDAVARSVSIAEVDVADAVLHARRDAQGLQVQRALVALTTNAPTPVPAATNATTAPPAPRAPSLANVAPSAGTQPGAPAQRPAARQERIRHIRSALGQLLTDVSSTWAIDVERVRASGATLNWSDTAVASPVSLRLTGANVEIGPASSRDWFATPLKAGAELDGRELSFDGRVDPAASSLAGAVRVDAVSLAGLAPYVPAQPTPLLVPMRLTSATLTTTGTIEARLVDAAPLPVSVVFVGGATLADLTMNPPAASDAALISARAFVVDGRATLGSALPTPTQSPAAASAPAPGLLAFAGQVGVDALRVGPVLAAPVDAGSMGPIALKELTLALNVKADARLGADAALALDADGTIDLLAPALAGTTSSASLGAVKLRGRSQIARTTDGTLTLTYTGEGDVADASARVPLAGPTAIDAQGATFKGTLSLAAPAPTSSAIDSAQTPRATFTLDANLGARGVKLGVPELYNADVRLANLSSTRTVFDTAKQSVSTDELALSGLVASVALPLLPPPGAPAAKAESGDGAQTGPTSPLTIAARAAAQAAAAVLKPLAGFSVAAGKVTLSDSTLNVLDATLPTAGLVVDQINASTGPVSSGGATTDLTLSARIQGTGSAKLSGRADLLDPRRFTDLNLNVAQLAIKPYDPFAGRYLGYLIESGRAGVRMPLKIDRSNLNAQVALQLDQFYLGKETDSPDAPGLPLPLGLALLRDSAERIEIDLPISGNVDEPGFNLGGLVWQALFNLISKAATAPFQLLAAVFGSGDQDLSFVAFPPGGFELEPTELAKLDTLARALGKRPALKLTVEGMASTKEDVPALTRRLMLIELARRGGIDPAQIPDVDKPEDDAKPVPTLAPAKLRQTLETWYAEVAGPIRRLDERGQDLPAPAIEALEVPLLKTIEVPPALLERLAKARADQVLRILSKDQAIASERLVADAPKVDAERAGAGFTLK
jgi:hypothetical protein